MYSLRETLTDTGSLSVAYKNCFYKSLRINGLLLVASEVDEKDAKAESPFFALLPVSKRQILAPQKLLTR